ncbi:thiamine pyrophosphate protein [Vulcanimicrobium alpinum]|uniref:Thiamine pyrophosphate protein n=1 Tax=Vulcanimicrobium alpinum TaxID=3016050 RepID=A0AAN2C9K4_UNVUL|nr:thiamine pyrophosphate-binding protein [Vulcanimicrobium alpinum]BDE06630.1 thiamine pyrophosphate protein [Vulcanimicrobium alpinum]
MALRSGGRVLVDVLRANGVERVFCVPGESYVAVLDALYDVPQIQVVACRHEAAAANMAEAYGKLTGRPGICFVTRAPGATHASIGVHTARQDSTPMLLFVGQVGRVMRDREAFQEIDYRQVFGGLAKCATEIDDARRIPELVTRAFATALAGRQGPVVIALPEDMLRDEVDVADLPAATRSVAHAASADVAEAHDMLSRAQRPLVILGGSGWDDDARAAMQAIARRDALPVACSFRRQHLFDNRDPHYAGDLGLGPNPALAARVRDADVILAIGGRLSEIPTSGYTLIEAPRPKQQLIHVHADANELGRVLQPALAINAGAAEFVRAFAALPALDAAAWRDQTRAVRAAYEANLIPGPSTAALDMADVVRFLDARLPDDAILCNGAGNYTTWLHRFYRYRNFRTQIGPTSGAMGYGVPAAIAAKLQHPERIVVAFAGDGCFLMSGHELATARQYGANIIVIVVNNGMYGTIRMHQERAYPGRVIATDLHNPDFAAYARSFGAYGAVVERTAEFAPAFETALAAGVPALLELRTDPESITPRTTLTEIRDAASSGLRGGSRA